MLKLSQRTANVLILSCVVAGFLLLMAIGLTGVKVMQRNLSFTDLVAHTYKVQEDRKSVV